MACEWGREDCINEDVKCYLCSTRDYHYQSKIKKKPKPMASRQAKINDRKGSGFEYKNTNSNKELLMGATSRQTPNSGAGQIKGDEEIRGIIKVMEELKEENKTTSRGQKTFTIQKEWLLKLRREAQAAGKEFWYLKYVFSGDDHDVFVTVDADLIMSMVYTMVEDRKAKYKAEADLDVTKKRCRLIEAENVKLQAKIDYLKAELKRLNPEFDVEAPI
jgi:hypothetical protein